MKIIQYLAVSVNGHITVGEDGTDWVTKATIQDFDKLNQDCGAIVMGRRTFESFGSDFPQPNCLNVVLTHNQDLLLKQISGALFTNLQPDKIVKMLQDKGFEKLFLIGGTTTNAAFLKAKLINEIWINIHPIIIGHGKYLFSEINEININNLELIGNDKFENNQVLLKYKLI